MSVFSRLLVFTLAAVCANAAPSPENIALAQKYAPQWRFHTDEVYFPSTVEYFLSNVQLKDGSGNVVIASPTAQTVDDATGQGSGMFLSTDINANLNGFLRGNDPTTGQDVVYTFIAPKANGIVDLYYWLFTPYNLAKYVNILGSEVGDHVGDWERMTVRTVNGSATQVDYHAHSDSGAGTVPWDEAPKFDNDARPVGYVAKGSHGFWDSAGTFTYVNAVIFKLQDETSDNGVYWDTQSDLMPLAYPDTFSGDLDWLNYKGDWGNKGNTDCWWHFIYDECQVVDGPIGPLRDDVLGAADAKTSVALAGGGSSSVSQKNMGGTLSHILGTTSTDSTSSYTLFIDEAVHNFAVDRSLPQLGVEQTCVFYNDTVDPQTNTTTNVFTKTFASTPLTDDSKYTIAPAACNNGTSVFSYTITLCGTGEADTCLYPTTEPVRKLRAYSADRSFRGTKNTTAIVVEDLDVWQW